MQGDILAAAGTPSLPDGTPLFVQVCLSVCLCLCPCPCLCLYLCLCLCTCTRLDTIRIPSGLAKASARPILTAHPHCPSSLPIPTAHPHCPSSLPILIHARLRQCVDHSPFSRRLGVLACFVEGKQNFHLTQLPLSEQRRLLLGFLRLSFNDSRAETYEPQVVSHNWADSPFTRGAYTGYLPPGVMSVPELWAAFKAQEKLPNVFFAGSDYHDGFGNGYIEGAIRSGQQAAALIHARLQGPRLQPA